MGRFAPALPLVGRIAAAGLLAGLVLRFAGFPWDLLAGIGFAAYAAYAVVSTTTSMVGSLAAQKSELEGAVRELARERDRMATFHALGHALSAQTEVEPLAELLLHRLCEFAAAETASVYVAREDGSLVLAVSRGVDRGGLPAVVDPGQGLTGLAAAARRTVAVSSGDRHELHLPLLQGTRVVGVAMVGRVDARGFADVERDAVADLAGQAAVALSNALSLAATRSAAALNRTVVETAADAFISMDEDGVLLAWNPQAEAMFGWPEEEALGTRVHKLIVPDRFRDAHVDERTRYLATGEPGRLGRRFETWAVHRDGHEVPVELTIVPVQLENGTRFHAFIRDIGERKRHERYEAAQYAVTRVLAESPGEEEALDGVLAALGRDLGWEMGAFWAVDENERRLHAAAVWEGDERQAGRFRVLCERGSFELGSGLPGRVWQSGEPIWLADLAAEARSERLTEAVDHGLRGAVAVPVLRGPDVLGVMEFFTRERNRPDHRLLVMLETIGNQVGQFMERKRAERRAEQMKDEFFALVSHELRTPLTSILGYLELVLEDDAAEDTLDDAQRRYLQVVERNARRLLRLVGDLLFVAQAQAGTLALDQGEFRLARLAAECVEAARPRAEEHGVELVADLAEVGPGAGDGERVAQALDNLLSNAIKFTPEGGRVDVLLRSDGGRAVLEVSDTGIGIAAHEAERLFERFYRASSATERAIPGVGLGLTIAQSIVEAHGGAIAVESVEGAGTTFRVDLPLAAPAGAPAPAANAGSALN